MALEWALQDYLWNEMAFIGMRLTLYQEIHSAICCIM
jgi:hypothetical protein